jgi:hypothetical protein
MAIESQAFIAFMQTNSQTNPSNRNQTLYFDDTFQGLPVMRGHGPLITEYLEALYQVMCDALADHKRVLAIRLDLRFPHDMEADGDVNTSKTISRFIDSLKAKIRHDRNRAGLQYRYAHNTEVRYVWAREIGQAARVHYHCALLLNRDAYFTLGKYGSDQPNMARRIMEAWASALGLQFDQSNGLVHFPENPVYRFAINTKRDMEEFFYRATYLCKAETKQFGNGRHGFGASRL